MGVRLPAMLSCGLLLGVAWLTCASEPQDIAFVSTHDQSEQRYVLVLPEGYHPGVAHDLLICLHGHGSDRWQFVLDPRDEARAAREIASKHEMILVSPDYRAKTSWMGPTAEADLVQILQELHQRYSIGRVVLSGGSMGGTSALTFTALHPDLVSAVVAFNGHANHLEYTGFQEAIQAAFGGTKQEIPEEYRKRSAEFFPERFNLPIAITAGGKDTIVPPESVMRLGHALRARNVAVMLDFQETRGHETEYNAALRAYAFVMEALGTPPIHVQMRVNNTATLPAPGSAAGVWFYAEKNGNTQVLLTGHPEVAGSWRLTASLGAGNAVRMTFDTNQTQRALLRFRITQFSPAPLDCWAEAGAVVISARSAPGEVQLSEFQFDETPARFAPERRPFSRGPVGCSPDLRGAVAGALVEWDWRMQDGIQTPREPRTFGQAMEKLIPQIDSMVAERVKSNTLTDNEVSAWRNLREETRSRKDGPSSEEEQWRKMHRLRRRIILGNPLFKNSPLFFVKHVPSVMSHQLTQVYGYCARPGGGLYVLTDPGVSMHTREITPEQLPPGNYMTPEISYDGQKVLFAYCPVKEAPDSWDFNERTATLRYHLYALSLASGAVRQLTQGDTDNFSPVQLPCGDVLFVSTRRGGFHRCGRGPCFVYTLARMEADGQNARSLSFHETHEWDPCLLNDGRVVYTRWDYVDRNAVHYEQLWSTLPDGTRAQVYYGNDTWNPAGIWEARTIPGSSRLMATAAPHHGMSAGSVIRIDVTQGMDGQEPLTRLTRDVRFPESESPLAFGPSPNGYDFDTPVKQFWRAPLLEPWMEKTIPEEEKRWPGHCYKSPWPLSENVFIVSYSFDQLVGEPGPNLPNMFGLYLADAFGNKELVYRDPAISSLWARPLAKRTPPPELSTPGLSEASSTGTFFLHHVSESWPQIPSDTRITQLRVIQVLLKTTPNADSPTVGAAFAAPGKQVLGTVPVETDGSAWFEVPARTPVLFQALDQEGRAIQTMRSLVYLQPGEHRSCVGCHEHRMKAPSSSTPALATRHPPSHIKPGPEGSRPFSYPRLVQPLLDTHCVRCHDGKDTKRSVLTGEPEGVFTKSYNALVKHVSFSAWGRPEQNFEPLTQPLRFGAAGSPLAKILDQKEHADIRLSVEDKERLNTWMDANALFYGTFNVDEQKKQLAGQSIAEPKE